jgi:hypothetical protein
MECARSMDEGGEGAAGDGTSEQFQAETMAACRKPGE